ncbi:hydroxymethylbilane synthase [Salibacteraceae bacterium]|nr:hydroxymethylbilane synthase [Salibacteraceae bacterium]HAW19238.1 hydroxymethylbilane synthase [Flavobacteriales bacterium]
MTKRIIIGSRGSDLALWQAHFFQDLLTSHNVESEIKIITTKGDRIQHLSFDKIEGKGFFTKEIEAALINAEIDIAIHSHKDLETSQPPGLVIGGVSYRENPSEYLLIRKECRDKTLPLGFKSGAVVGTSSARRKSQVLELRPDISLKDIRGNVPTRIQKLRDGEFDAIMLAAAGVIRLELDLSDLIVCELDPRMFIPAAAQGVLAYQCRESDEETKELLSQLNHPDVAECIRIERTILSKFGGGCHIPIGVYAQNVDGQFHVRASFGKEWEQFGKRSRIKAQTGFEVLNKFEELKSQALPKNALITKTLDDSSFLRRACQAHGIALEESPMIQIEPIPFTLKDTYDWVFFSSKNGVESYFLNSETASHTNVKYAAYGEATARSLSRYVELISYTGALSQPTEIAMDFAKVAEGSKVLFPTSDISLGSIPSALPPEMATILPVYKTVSKPELLDQSFDAYIFTSPSNVRGFFENNGLPDSNSKLISIGESTSNELTSLGYVSEMADFAHDAELFALVCS